MLINTSIKRKFLVVQVLILAAAFGSLLYLSSRSFLRDKTLSIRDLNLALLDGTTTVITYELRTRLEAFVKVLPDIILNDLPENESEKIFKKLPGKLSDEIYRITLFRQSSDDAVKAYRTYQNQTLLSKNKIDDRVLGEVDNTFPPTPGKFTSHSPIEIQNRSLTYEKENKDAIVPILTLYLSSESAEGQTEKTVVAIDLDQGFLLDILRRVDATELYLITKDGRLVSHPNTDLLGKYGTKPDYAADIVAKLNSKSYLTESLEVEIAGESYLCSARDTGISGILLVSQIRQSEAFSAVRTLMAQTTITGGIIIWIAVVLIIIFTGQLTKNIRTLGRVAEDIGSGNLDPKFEIKSNDEIRNVADSLEWMVSRVKDLLTETREKGRMEEELKTAALLQDTLLKTQGLDNEYCDIITQYTPASECSGDFFDLRLKGERLVFAIADATGHGAPAAIVTAVAKSSLETLNLISGDRAVGLKNILTTLNRVVYSSCKGQLLVTMCLIELDLATGILTVCNAGHESPLCWRKSLGDDPKNQGKPKAVEQLMVTGERLGFDPHAKYETQTFQLEMGDVLLLYTDGISEAPNKEGKEWGERALKKSLAEMTYVNTEQQIRQEIIDLLSQISVAESRIEVLSKSVEVAQKGYEISLERFRAGTITSNDIAQAQQRLTNSKLNNLVALIDYRLGVADLTRKTLWDFEENKPAEVIAPVE